MFKEYESKPITRKAFQLKAHTDFTYDVDEDIWTLYLGGGYFDFNAPKGVVPAVGGWVVYLNSTDVYYCSDEVFREKNVVDEG